jgi:hypothetical protein
MLIKIILLGVCLTSTTLVQPDDRVNLGVLQTGATVSFVMDERNEWGIEISSDLAPRLRQPQPAKIEIFSDEEEILLLTAGYSSIRQSGPDIEGRAEIEYVENVVFRVQDVWSIQGNVITVQRNVEVTGNAPGGFNSSVVLAVDPSVRWDDIRFMAPGALYGDTEYNGERAPGGSLNHAARRFLMREDILSAPLFALSFEDGSTVAMLNPSPKGDSTVEETRVAKAVMTDARYQFGALGAWQHDEHPIEFGFRFPGTMSVYPFGPDAPVVPRWIRRYHPVDEETAHSYEVSFRFGLDESFRDMTRNAWRWAWDTLEPTVLPADIELIRRVLTDHLAAQAATIDGRTSIPFAVATFDTTDLQWNWTMAGLGFVSKNIESADQLLREGDRDTTARGQEMRRIGLAVISSMIQALSTVPLEATGYDLATGEPWVDHIWLAPWLRNATEDMVVLMRAYQRERGLGRTHSEWFDWLKSYVDWLILQQREDGSFPRRWESGSDEVAEETGTVSYAPVPLLVLMAEETEDPVYMQSAVRAAEYIWENWGQRGFYVGGTSDNPNIADKEAGMLSLEAFLSLYESTNEPEWLERAAAAADFAETWIWIWDLPMPLDADDADLHWKKGVPVIGLQGITTRASGGVDTYMSWSAPSYAKLYRYTKDPHYLDVARVLLHGNKSMIALPGRTYDMKGVGWQQEHWGMGPGWRGRGVGGHRFWLPWVSANNLYSITGLEEFDPALYRQLIEQ